MLLEFKTHIENHFSNLKENKFLLACSGGLDSIVLMHLCKQLDLDFDVAHCNFRLRGEESDGDEKFVLNFSENLEIKFHVTHFDTLGYMNKNGVNVQIAARDLRYAWFAELMQQNDIFTLVTAHHADDSLETFLINLSRGTGIDGLKGIPEKTETIARPLLGFSRNQILAYAQSEELRWREDSSNNEVKYLRNKIRHEVIPSLKELHPTFLENFQKTQIYLSDTSKILDNHINLLKSKVFEKTEDGYRVSLNELGVLYPQQSYIRMLFKPYGFTAFEDIAKLLKGLSGKEVYSKTHRLVRDREHLLLTVLKHEESLSYSIHSGQSTISEPIQMQISGVDRMNETSNQILYTDKAALKYPLTVRKWKKGDYFYPFGMQGKKKLSKYFKDERVDIIAKGKQWLLCSEDKIVWVIGRRGDRRFSVTDNTKEIIKFEVHT